VDEAHRDTPGGGAFDLYRENGDPASDERRVLVHSDHIYGVNRQIERLLFDIPHDVSGWHRYVRVDIGYSGTLDTPWWARLYVNIRPILTDFDPATITWNGAYGASPLSFGRQLIICFAGEVAASTLSLTVAAWPPANGTAEVDETIPVPGLLVTQAHAIHGPGDLPISDWNAETAIYGWEIAVDTDASGKSIAWTGCGLDMEARCFAIRK
jgi:hypothetical protein